MSVLNIIFGFLCLYAFHYLLIFINWFNQGWQLFSSKLPAVLTFTVFIALFAGIVFLLHRWIAAQLAAHQTKLAGTGVLAAASPANTGARVLAVLLLLYSVWNGVVMFNTLRMLAKGSAPDELLDPRWELWHFLPAIVHMALIVLGAFALLQNRATAVLYLGSALGLSLIGIGYQLVLDPGYFVYLGRALPQLAIIQALPLAYAIMLLRKGNLGRAAAA